MIMTNSIDFIKNCSDVAVLNAVSGKLNTSIRAEACILDSSSDEEKLTLCKYLVNYWRCTGIQVDWNKICDILDTESIIDEYSFNRYINGIGDDDASTKDIETAKKEIEESKKVEYKKQHINKVSIHENIEPMRGNSLGSLMKGINING